MSVILMESLVVPLGEPLKVLCKTIQQAVFCSGTLEEHVFRNVHSESVYVFTGCPAAETFKCSGSDFTTVLFY